MESSPTRRFAALVRQGGTLPLDEALLLIAAHAIPALDITDELARLDALADGMTEPTFDGLRAHLFGTLGFTGDQATYYDPRNSLLPAVLDRRRGLPITLSALAIAVGGRRGVVLEGIALPGHFVARCAAEPHRYLDAFSAGRELDAAGCRALCESAAPGAAWHDDHLAPASTETILARVLANLAVAYRRSGDRPGLCWALDLRLTLPGASREERRELGVLLGASGRFAEGAAVLERSGEERDQLAAARLRARLN